MNTVKQHFGFSPKIVVLAVLAAFGPAHAEDGADDVAQLIKPESSVSIGIGGSTGDDREDRSIFGQYNGLRDHDYNLLLDIDYVTRDDGTGQWTVLQARNLGLDNREAGVLLQRQGDWKLSVEYDEITKHDIRTVNTADTGVGSTTPVINVLGVGLAGTGTDHDFELRRQGITLSGDKWITPDLQFEVSFKNEEKEGERRTGRGYDCVSNLSVCATGSSATNVQWATLMIAEPIDTTTRQLDAKLNWSGDKFLLSAGYYGSFFSNSDGNVQATVPGSLLNATRSGLATLNPAAPGGTSLQEVLQLPMALPPDNQAHQFYLDGFYAFTPTTRGTAKIAYTHATQDDSFSGNGFTGPAGRNNLGGELNTTLLQLGLTAKPLPKLSLLGNVRYENRQDETPIDDYNLNSLTGPTFTNGHISNRKLGGKLEASYLLPQDIRATAGIDYEEVKRSIVDSATLGGISALRKDVDETGYRLELRRSLGETINAAIGYKNSRRRGGDWYNLNTGAFFAAAGYAYGDDISASEYLRLAAIGATGTPQTATTIFPVMLQDRNRHNWKASADWTPTERLSMQFVFENSDDSYENNGVRGVQDGGSRLYSVDAVFTVSEKWKLTGYASHFTQDQEQAWSSGYNADLHNTNTSAGLGVLGNPTARLQVGGDLSYSYDNNEYGLSLPVGNTVSAGPTPPAGTAVPYPTAANAAIFATNGGFPDVTYRQFTLKLFGKYAVQKNADIRVDLVHQRNELKEWSWNYNGTPFTYSDNTTVTLDDNQQVTFIGASYIYKF